MFKHTNQANVYKLFNNIKKKITIQMQYWNERELGLLPVL